MVKYVLIVSQYYHSYVQLICKVEENVIDNARKMIDELEEYKRFKGEKGSYYYGYFDKKYLKGTSEILENGGRINLNDAGDIYFEFSDSIMHLANEMSYYNEKAYTMSRVNRKSKNIEKDISNHHNSQIVTDIIKKYFLVA